LINPTISQSKKNTFESHHKSSLYHTNKYMQSICLAKKKTQQNTE